MERDDIKTAIRDVRKGMSVLAAATKHGLTRNTLRYHIQKADAARNAFVRALEQERHS